MIWEKQRSYLKAPSHSTYQGRGIGFRNREVIPGSGWLQFREGQQRRPVTLLSAVYEGVLEATDPVLFRQVLTEGIGRGKTYGQGLLTVIRGGAVHG